jgi:hypothetical protein
MIAATLGGAHIAPVHGGQARYEMDFRSDPEPAPMQPNAGSQPAASRHPI